MKALNLLVAEDNPDHAELIIDVLAECNKDNIIHHVFNGRELLNYLDSISNLNDGPIMLPDIILLDIKMPLVGGIDALKVLKSHSVYKTIPVIVLSTSAHDKDIADCYEQGANSYIVKPFESADFELKLHELNAYWANISELP